MELARVLDCKADLFHESRFPTISLLGILLAAFIQVLINCEEEARKVGGGFQKQTSRILGWFRVLQLINTKADQHIL